MFNTVCNCSQYFNEYNCYRSATDVRDILPSSVSECKHSHVMGWYSICYYSVPPGVGFVHKGLRGALILEIACTFDPFTEQTFSWKTDGASHTCGPGLMFDFGRLTHVSKPAVRGRRMSAGAKQLVSHCSIWAVTGLSVWHRRCLLLCP